MRQSTDQGFYVCSLECRAVRRSNSHFFELSVSVNAFIPKDSESEMLLFLSISFKVCFSASCKRDSEGRVLLHEVQCEPTKKIPSHLSRQILGNISNRIAARFVSYNPHLARWRGGGPASWHTHTHHTHVHIYEAHDASCSVGTVPGSQLVCHPSIKPSLPDHRSTQGKHFCHWWNVVT